MGGNVSIRMRKGEVIGGLCSYCGAVPAGLVRVGLGGERVCGRCNHELRHFGAINVSGARPVPGGND